MASALQVVLVKTQHVLLSCSNAIIRHGEVLSQKEIYCGDL